MHLKGPTRRILIWPLILECKRRENSYSSIVAHDMDQGRQALFPPVKCDKKILDTEIFIVVNSTTYHSSIFLEAAKEQGESRSSEI